MDVSGSSVGFSIIIYIYHWGTRYIIKKEDIILKMLSNYTMWWEHMDGYFF
jgi:hypothetical protein